MRRTTIAISAVLATALSAAPAHAGFFQAEPIDGPSADIVKLGDADMARDGTGAVAYIKREGGVDHVFVSRLTDGAFQSPERIDGAFGEPGSQPVVAAVDNGRVAVAFVSGTQLYVVLKPAGDQPWGSPQPIAGAGANVFNPSIDMSIHGTGYLSFTVPGGSVADVRVARLDRKATTWDVLPDALDIDASKDAGNGNGRSKVVVSADGTAVVIWGEAGHVYARRVFDGRLSTAPQDLNVDQVDGHPGGLADLPDIDIEDDSSFAWAVFRQQLDDGRWHTIARRLVGSQFDPPTLVDGLGFGGDQTRSAFVDLNGRGEGIALTDSMGGGAFSALLHDDQFFASQLLNPGNGVDPKPVGGMAENNDGYAAWLQGTGPGDTMVHAVAYDIDPAKRTVPPPGPDTVLTSPDLGGVDVAAGLDMGVNRAGDAAAVFVQGTGDGRRLMTAGFDRDPGTFRTYTTAKWRKFARPPLSWAASFDIWGAITYRVEIDGQSYGETKDRTLTPLNAVPDGEHNWRVVAIDRRGQTEAAPTRLMRVDATPPTVTFTVKGTRKAGKPVKVAVKANDVLNPKASGVAVVRIDYGDGFQVVGRKAVHRYARRGAYTVRVSATDTAGNAIAVKRRIRIKKA
jgi:hypothetical protein